jgi:cytochrome c oxidase subunit 1
MHYLGLIGMPRRVYTYPPGLGWDLWNLVATIGAYLIAISALLFVFNVIRSLRSGARAGDDPWQAPDLEWATSSPPPPHNFTYLPIVQSAEPLWHSDEIPVVRGATGDKREVLLTSAVEAAPGIRWQMPEPSLWPLVSALALTVLFIWSVFSPWGVVWGAIPVAIALTFWFWPSKSEQSE